MAPKGRRWTSAATSKKKKKKPKEGGVVVVVTDMTDGRTATEMAAESEKMTREISFPEQERESDARRREGSGVGKKKERKKEVGEMAIEAHPSC